MTELSDAILAGIQTAMRNAHVCLPGRILSYDLQKKTAEVELQLQRGVPRTDGLGLVAERFPSLRNVPVQQPAAGGFFVHFPVKVGDFVWVHFSDMTIDRYRAKGSVTDPGDHRLHHLANAWCVPMYDPAHARTPTDGHANNLVIGKVGGSQIHVKPSGVISLGSESPASKVALATKCDAEHDKLRAAIHKIFSLLQGPSTPPPAGEDPPAGVWVPVPTDGGGALQIAAASALSIADGASVASAKVSSE